MKKILYILIMVAVSGLSFTACTEEAVTPKTEEGNNGGGNNEPDPLKP